MGATIVEISTTSKHDFDFISVIGKGGFSRVWKAKHKNTKMLFALKEISKLKIIDKHLLPNIQREASIHSTLWNEFIVNCLGSFQEEDKVYLVLKYFKGGDLRYYMWKHKCFSEEQTKFFIACVMLAIGYVNSKGVVHRDIKPENLVFNSNGYLLLNDFGLAMHKESQIEPEASGTLEYLPPEAFWHMNRNVHDKATAINNDKTETAVLTPSFDYYSIGIVLYELVFGYRPYHFNTQAELIEAKLNKQIKVLPCQIPKRWDSNNISSLINSLLIINPKERLGSNEGITEITHHPWFKGFSWDKLQQRKLISPFIPQDSDNNYNTAYCEDEELIGTETMARYQNIIKDSTNDRLFNDFKYINVHLKHQFPLNNKSITYRNQITTTTNNTINDDSYWNSHSNNVSNILRCKLIRSNPLMNNNNDVQLPLLNNIRTQSLCTKLTTANTNTNTYINTKSNCINKNTICIKGKTLRINNSITNITNNNSIGKSSSIKMRTKINSLDNKQFKKINNYDNPSQFRYQINVLSLDRGLLKNNINRYNSNSHAYFLLKNNVNSKPNIFDSLTKRKKIMGSTCTLYKK